MKTTPWFESMSHIDFLNQYPTNEACLLDVFKRRYGHWQQCPKCQRGFNYHRIKNRKAYCCQWCGHQIYPLKGTAFEKSSTPLRLWYWLVFQFSTGVMPTAKAIQRELGVTYKTAWRMKSIVSSLFQEETSA